MPTVRLTDRALIDVAGPDAESLLQNIITTDLGALDAGEARPGALLTPQGKILFDFLISRTGEDGLRLDCRREAAEDLRKRLMLYKLRAKAEISLQDHEDVLVSWQNDSSASQNDSSGIADRRFTTATVTRRYGGGPEADATEADWHRLRVEGGVGEGISDFALGDAFPHDLLLDHNGGVGLKKGCFVGQEVVSRMHHRGTARRRLLILRGEAPLPSSGTEVTADGRALGTLGTVCGDIGLAILRVDRAGEARAAGTDILAGTVPVALEVPAYADITLGGKAESA